MTAPTRTADPDPADPEETFAYTTTTDLVHDGERWAADWSRSVLHPDLGPQDALALTRAPAERGEVLDGAGGVLVTERPVLRIGLDKANLPEADVAGAAVGLATALGFADPQAFADRAAAAGPRAFVEAMVVRALDSDVDLRAVRRLPGVLMVDDTLPLAPTSRFARPILGTVGPATAEIVAEGDGAVRAGDEVGLSGLQRQYDAVLRGTPGVTVALRRADGTTTDLLTLPPVPGQDLAVTLDARRQMIAEEILADVEPASAVVALRPSTGEVLVAASGPGSQGLSTATLGAYAPGSTFKVATALALLRAGLAPDTPLQCPPTVTADGREFSNYPGFPAADLGPTTLAGAIASSCNTALIGSRDRIDATDLAGAAAALGVGAPAEAGVPYVAGQVPADATGTEHAAALIGQGRVQASPLAMAGVAASVARGALVAPVLVSAVGDEPRSTPAAVRAPAGPAAAAPLTEAEAQALRGMMRAVVTDGTATFLTDVPGEPVAAKSGTAEFGAGAETGAHAWMIAFQGDLAVAVFVEEGVAGAQTAGPLLEEFLRQAA